MTRKIIELVLTRGLNITLDVAGSFIPGWSLIKPILEKIVEDLPGDFSKMYRSSEDDVDKILLTLENNDVLIEPIRQALVDHGITNEWAEESISLLERLSDDVFELIAKQNKHEESLNYTISLLERLVLKKPAKLELRAQFLDYTKFYTVPEAWMNGWHLAPGSKISLGFAGRHIPTGAMIWDFLLLNTGQQLATISKMEVCVEDEFPCSEEAVIGGVKPSFDEYEDMVEMVTGASFYPVFKNKRLKYAPEKDIDAFRILFSFIHDYCIVQKIKLAIHWQDGTGEHTSYGPSLFICSDKT